MLTCTSKKVPELSVRVLSEELAYNRALKQFKIFIVEHPLDPSHKVVYMVSEILLSHHCVMQPQADQIWSF